MLNLFRNKCDFIQQVRRFKFYPKQLSEALRLAKKCVTTLIRSIIVPLTPVKCGELLMQ